MSDFPTGTVTFLFTDVEGSTELAQAHPAEWEAACQRHQRILREAIEAHHGYVFQAAGDAFCVAFHNAADALESSIAAQRALRAEDWAETPVRVRMGLHTGAAEAHDGEYRGYLTLAHAERVMSVGHGAQMIASHATAALLLGQLPGGITLRDLGEHRLKGLLNPEHLWQVIAPDLPQDFPPLPSLDAIPNNLPIHLTSFVGRERELAELRRLLPTTRLLTLTGSGGTGKTRLSLELAAAVRDEFRDGAWLIELAPLSDPELLPITVASVLGVREEPGRSLMDTLLEWIRPKRLLLILDNCEHLIEASAKFADAVLHASRETRILASSREALGIAGELAWRVPSLPTPRPNEAVDMARLEQFAAARLFSERATFAFPSFRVTSANAHAVAQICYRLDGIPLAIELAAARVKLFPAEQIATRLDDRFRLLTGGSRTALPRQQTLRSLIDWSYDLLSEPERMLLRRLSVFVGGWSLEAAEAICSSQTVLATVDSAVPMPRLATEQVLDLLSRLVDKSLVVAEDQAGSARYHMLETIRQYAREKLLDAYEGKQLRDQHLQFFARFAAEFAPNLHGTDQLQWLESFDAEHDNLRAAIEWCSHEHDPIMQLQLPANVAHFRYMRGYHSEGEEALRKALARTQSRTESPQWARARMEAINALMTLLWSQGKASQAQPFADEAVSLAERLADLDSLAQSCRIQGMTAMLQGHYAESRRWLVRGLDLMRDSGDLNYLGTVRWMLADEAYFQSDYERARPLYVESVAALRQVPEKHHVGYPLRRLGYVAIHQRELDLARDYIAESLTHNLAVMEGQGVLGCVAAMAALSVARGQCTRAVSLFGSVARHLPLMHIPLMPSDQLDHDRFLGIARSQLVAAEFDAAWAAGQAWDLEQAVQFALHDEA